jgi:hypothetical protein
MKLFENSFMRMTLVIVMFAISTTFLEGFYNGYFKDLFFRSEQSEELQVCLENHLRDPNYCLEKQVSK